MNVIKNFDGKWSVISLGPRYTKLFFSNDGVEVRKHTSSVFTDFRQLVREINHEIYNEVNK